MKNSFIDETMLMLRATIHGVGDGSLIATAYQGILGSGLITNRPYRVDPPQIIHGVNIKRSLIEFSIWDENIGVSPVDIDDFIKICQRVAMMFGRHTKMQRVSWVIYSPYNEGQLHIISV